MRSHIKLRLDKALIVFALISVSSLASAKTPQQQANGRAVLSAADFAESVGGQLSTFSSAALTGGHRLRPNTNNPTAHVRAFTFTRTSTGWDEPFLIGFPAIPPTEHAPLLVLWHKWSTSEYDTWENTRFFEEATNKGWYVIAPRAAHQFHFGIEYGQRNTEELIAFMNDSYLPRLLPGQSVFNKEKIYGVGFSMGGAVVSYGCRHLDPTKFPYAAIFNLTGTMSAAYGWQHLPPPPLTNPTAPNTELRNHPEMFGGGGPGIARNSFHYKIASTVHLWPPPNVVDPTCDLLRNIPEINVFNTYVIGDPHPNTTQVDRTVAWANNVLGFTKFLFQPLPPNLGVADPHSWGHISGPKSAIDELWITTWLDGKTFTKPAGYAQILADRDVRYYDISVTQNPSLVAASPQGIFSPFEFDASNVSMPLGNTLWLKSSRETAALEIHSSDMGLTTTLGTLLTLDLNGPVTPTPVQIILNDYIATPTLVTRNGVAPTGANTWSFSGSKITIHESNPSSTPTPTRWTITL